MKSHAEAASSMREEDIRPDHLLAGHIEAHRKDISRLLQRQSEFVTIPCPACGSSESRAAFEKDRSTFVECENCATIYMNPRPTPEIMTDYYQDSEKYRYWAKYIFPISEAGRKERLYFPWIKRIKQICEERGVPHGRLLEVGAGFGAFAQTAILSGVFEDVIVIEPTPEMAVACRDRNLNVIEKRIEDTAPEEVGTVDVLVTFEVLEHLFMPSDLLRQAHRLLSPGGLLVVSCPNGQGFDIMTLGSIAKAVDIEHVNLLNPASLKKMLEAENFRDVRIDTPGQLDAELVRKAVLSGEYTLNSPFLKRVLLDEWEILGGAFQEFLANNKLSSHMWAYAQR